MRVQLTINLSCPVQEHDEVLSTDANDAAFHIDRRLQLGSKLSDVVKSKEDAIALFNLYKDEGYILTELEGKYCVSLSVLNAFIFFVTYLVQLNSRIHL